MRNKYASSIQFKKINFMSEELKFIEKMKQVEQNQVN